MTCPPAACPKCDATMYPDATRDEARCGKLRWRCHAGHSAYQDVPPILTAAQRANDAFLAAVRVRLRARRIVVRPTLIPCDVCALPVDPQHGRRRHEACHREHERRARVARSARVQATRRPGPALIWTAARAGALARPGTRGSRWRTSRCGLVSAARIRSPR